MKFLVDKHTKVITNVFKDSDVIVQHQDYFEYNGMRVDNGGLISHDLINSSELTNVPEAILANEYIINDNFFLIKNLNFDVYLKNKKTGPKERQKT